MSIRQYFKNVSLLFVVNFTIKPIWVFGIERKFHLLLGNELYGSYFSSLSLIYILSVFLDMGLHNYAVKFISNKKEDYKGFLSELWMSKLILIGVYIEVSMLVLISLENDRFYDISEGDREKGE